MKVHAQSLRGPIHPRDKGSVHHTEPRQPVQHPEGGPFAISEDGSLSNERHLGSPMKNCNLDPQYCMTPQTPPPPPVVTEKTIKEIVPYETNHDLCFDNEAVCKDRERYRYRVDGLGGRTAEK